MTNEDTKKWMWFRALTMLEKAEYLRQGMLPIKESQAKRIAWQPPVDIFEVENILWVVMALPGVAPESVSIVNKSGILFVRGERHLSLELRRSVVHRLEIPHGYFERKIELPAGYYELKEHQLTDGCLVLQLDKLS